MSSLQLQTLWIETHAGRSFRVIIAEPGAYFCNDGPGAVWVKENEVARKFYK